VAGAASPAHRCRKNYRDHQDNDPGRFFKVDAECERSRRCRSPSVFDLWHAARRLLDFATIAMFTHLVTGLRLLEGYFWKDNLE
jgi:hypothetical protein